MARFSSRTLKGSAADAALRTWILIITGFIVFYFGSQAVTAEDAHLWHWGLALVGGVLGWSVGVLVARLRNQRQ